MDIPTTVSAFTLIVFSVSAILVFLQLRQVEKSINGSTYQALVEAADRIHMLFVRFPELAEIWNPLEYVTSKGDPKEIRRDWLAVAIMDHYENMYFQFKQGTMPKKIWEGWELHINKVFQRNTVFRAKWPASREFYFKEFREYVDNIIKNSPTIKPNPTAQ